MKKLLLCLIFLTFIVWEGKSQIVKCSFGIKGIGQATMMDCTPKPEGMNFGGGGGAFIGLRFGKVLGVQGEFLYTLQGAKFGEDGYDITLSQTYYHIPVVLQLWASRGVIFELGYQQSLKGSAKLKEGREKIDDEGALDYGSLLAGITFNFGKVMFLNARYTYGLNESYVIYGETSKTSSIQVGLGFRFYTSKRSVFK